MSDMYDCAIEIREALREIADAIREQTQAIKALQPPPAPPAELYRRLAQDERDYGGGK